MRGQGKFEVEALTSSRPPLREGVGGRVGVTVRAPSPLPLRGGGGLTNNLDRLDLNQRNELHQLNTTKEHTKMETAIVIWVLILILIVFTLFACVKAVPQGSIWTVERFGAYTRMMQPGLNFVLPYIDRVGRKLNVQEQVVEIPEQSVITLTTPPSPWTASLLPRDGTGKSRVSGHQPDPRADHAGDDQHPRGDRRDGTRRHALLTRADQHRAAGHPRRRHGTLGREGQPR